MNCNSIHTSMVSIEQMHVDNRPVEVMVWTKIELPTKLTIPLDKFSAYISISVQLYPLRVSLPSHTACDAGKFCGILPVFGKCKLLTPEASMAGLFASWSQRF